MRWVLASLAAAFLSVSSASAQMPGFLRRDEEPAELLLPQVAAGAFAERCSAPLEDIEDEQAEAYDLVDMLVGAPTAVRHDVPLLNGRAQQYLTNLLRYIAEVQPHPQGIQPTVHIEHSSFVDARQVRAGEIIVTAGMIDAMIQRVQQLGGDSQQMAERWIADMGFILAHEYAHVLLCHYNRQVAVSRNRRALRSAAGLGLLAVYLGNSSATRTPNGLVVTTDNDAAGEDALVVLAGMTLLRTANSSIVNPAWSRQQERDADRLALELLRARSIRLDYANELLQALHDADDASTRSFAQIFSQVPAQAVSAFALSLGQPNQSSSFREAMTVVGLNAGLQAFQQWRENQLRHFHDPPERRIRGMAPMLALLNTESAEQQRAEIQTSADFDRGSWGPGFEAAYGTDSRAPELAEQAFTLFATENVDAGCTVAEQALAADRESVPALRACGQCEIHRRNLDRARRHLDRAIDQDLARPEDFQHVLGLWLEVEQRERVDYVVRAGIRRFPERFYLVQMYVLDQYGERSQIPAVAAECAAAPIAQPYRDECTSEAQRILSSPERQPQGPGTQTAPAGGEADNVGQRPSQPEGR